MSRFVRLLIGLVCLSTALLAGSPRAVADTIAVRSADLRLEDDTYVLNADFDFALNPTLEEALQKGVPLYFVLDFELRRPRWYWIDQKIIALSIQYRVSYDVLTQQYRVGTGLLSMHLNSLEEVERLISRVAARPVARKDELEPGERYEARIRLRLDVTQLPKPFQLNALGSRDWSLQSDWYAWSVLP
jgi:hypothetical protein